MRILNSCVVHKFETVNPGYLSTIPAAYLLCSTAIQQDIHVGWCFCSCELPFSGVECVVLHCFNAQAYIFAVVNGTEVALSVFYSPLTPAPITILAATILAII